MAAAPATPATLAAYREAMDYIFNRLNYERVPHDSYKVEDFRLARMTRLLELLGNPQERLPVVHVAGTKGKGSTSAMLASMLQAAGLRTGLFTSPHLTDFEERFTVDGALASKQQMVDVVSRLRNAVEQLAGEMPPGPTYFEITTALAWLHFTAQKCDIAVLEVGLGGRLDSTNVCRPLCSIITSISRDHTRLLGETLAEIATEKAGIIKPGVPVLSGTQQADAAGVIDAVARQTGATLFVLGREIQWTEANDDPSPSSLRCFRINVATPWHQHEGLLAPLPGRHQCRNLSLAVAAFDVLNATWRPLKRDAIQVGLANCSWPLRIEQVSEHPRVIIDTAHNDASIAALCETLSPLKHARRVVVFGTSRDKDAAAMLKILNEHFDEVVLTRYVINPRALAVEPLVEIAKATLTIPYTVAETIPKAWETVRLAGPDDLVCVTGSMFLAAEARELARGAIQ